ncbi:MAG: hypothetical protein BGO67_02215 [Alphaproteobacteria bacterium 41-28]|nr:MAG: hypothetical protein BGO67_02215 [Alphaproteobacteria bacterium 41-28]
MFQDLPKRIGLYPSIIFSLMLGGTPLFFESDSAAKIRGGEVAYTEEDHNKYIKKLKISIRLEKKKIREIRASIAKQKRLEVQKRRYKKRQERGRTLQLRRQKRQQERQIAQRIRLKSKHYILKEEVNVLRSVALHLRRQHAEASQLTQQLAETLRVARQRQEELQQQAPAQQAAVLGLPQQQPEAARQREDALHLTQQLAETVRIAQQREEERQQQELVQQTAMLQLHQQEGEALHLAQQLAETLHIAQQWEGERQRQELVQEAGILRLHQQQAEILLLVQQLAGTLRIAQQGIEEHQRQGRAFVPQQPEEQSFAPPPAPPLPLLTSQLFVEHPHQERIEKTQDGKRRSQEQVEAEQQIQQGVQKEHQQPDQTLASVHPAVPLSHFEQLITEAKRRKDLRQAAGYQIQEGALQEDRIDSGNEDKGKEKRARSPETDQQNAFLNRLAQIRDASLGTSLVVPEDGPPPSQIHYLLKIEPLVRGQLQSLLLEPPMQLLRKGIKGRTSLRFCIAN